MIENITFIEVLRNADKYSWSDTLYSSEKRPTEKTVCKILTKEDAETSEPADMVYLLNVHQIQDVVSNLKQQRANITDADLIEAIHFYLDHDAFIVK